MRNTNFTLRRGRTHRGITASTQKRVPNCRNFRATRSCHTLKVAPYSCENTDIEANDIGQLGETVSRRMAGDLLGVSHTALGRWIAAGDLPTVFTPRGRTEIPVNALLDLRERSMMSDSQVTVRVTCSSQR
jgi:hypothetical protein